MDLDLVRMLFLHDDPYGSVAALALDSDHLY